MTEKQIENQILTWLCLSKIMSWKNQSVGIYDAKKKIYRKSFNKHHRNGVADIIGIYKGKPLFIEVKAGKNKPTETQKEFLKEAIENGAIAFVAYSLEQAKETLKGI